MRPRECLCGGGGNAMKLKLYHGSTKIMRERRHMDGRYFDEVCDILAAGKELT